MNFYLSFSDAAKYADIARSLLLGEGYKTTFSFFLKPYFTGMWIPPVMPFSIAAFFKIFGVNDFAVIATSFFYFILTLVFTFLLAKKVYANKLIAILSTLAVGSNYSLVTYATGGASESPFIFEIVAAAYLVSLRKKFGNIAAFLFLILMYFTRPQAFIYIAGIILYYTLLNFKTKTAIIFFAVTSLVGFLVDKFVLSPLSGNYFIYSVLERGSNVLSQVGVGQSASEQLRSGVLTYNFSIIESLKKVFYNLYNFYKLLPQIMSPYLFTLFILGFFGLSKDRIKNTFKISVIFITALTFLVAGFSIPFYRYIHPVIPFVYIVAVGTLVELISNFNRKFLVLNTLFLVVLFAVGQTLGIIFLDSRFERNTHNVDRPPVYFVLSNILNENTNTDDVVITNLDTWGSWYGERKTVWFPLEPKQLIDQSSGKIPFDSIYLTSYLMDDQNYYMGDGWRQIFDSPNDPQKWICDGCSEIAKEFKLKSVYAINSSEDYERQDAKAVLLVRK